MYRFLSKHGFYDTPSMNDVAKEVSNLVIDGVHIAVVAHLRCSNDVVVSSQLRR
jgi:hypothetical protein